VRVVLVLLALGSGFGLAGYVAAWLLLPLEGEETSIAARAMADRRGIAIAIAFLPALAVFLIVATALRAGYLDVIAWALFVSGAGLVLVYRNAGEIDRVWLRHAARPLLQVGQGPRRSRLAFVGRVAAGVLLLAGGLLLLVHGQRPLAALRPLGGAVLVLAAIVVLFGPWWLKLVRDLFEERQARVRAEERADMAARVHDSVLQTLALIRWSADQPQRVAQLARAQERELRSWLVDGRTPGSFGDDGTTTVGEGLKQIAREVEAAHGVNVDAVNVGDCPVDEDLEALLAAGREATVNAAKWSGSPSISLFVEVEPRQVSMFVRDRGRGFDPGTVPPDRQGIAESIRGRMARSGGRAAIRSALGAGTEVQLTMSRRNGRR
jgi:signal transduction histidine kinase